MTPAARIRLARLRLSWCRIRAAYARARVQLPTLRRTLCVEQPWLVIVALLWLLDVLIHNALLALYVAPSIIGAVRQRHGAHSAIAANLLLGWTIVGWCWVMFWAMLPNTAPAVRVPVRTRANWYVSSRKGITL